MIPTIDPQVKYLGTSYLRTLNSETMKAMEGAVVIQDADAQPLVVIVPYSTYIRMQEEVHRLADLMPKGTPFGPSADLQEYLETEREEGLAKRKASGHKPSKREAAVQERATGDVVAQRAGREDIDYSDVESAPTVNVANLRGTTGAMSAATKKTTENWRANRRPLLKPGDRKKE